MKVVREIEGKEKFYLNCLNKSYNTWGDEALYRWTFKRKVQNNCTVQMILSDKGEFIAGSGVSFRKILINKEKIDIGIMTGSWTLPAARGKGAFTKIIEASLDIVEEKGYQLLTAFVVKTNPSYRRLKEAGSLLIPTHYLVREKEKEIIGKQDKKFKSFNVKDSDIESLYCEYMEGNNSKLRFFYEKKDWKAQFLQKPPFPFLVQWKNMNCLLEEVKDIFKVQYLSQGNKDEISKFIQQLILFSSIRNKNLLFFTTQSSIVEISKKLNFIDNPGYLTILGKSSVPDIKGLEDHVLIHSADRM